MRYCPDLNQFNLDDEGSLNDIDFNDDVNTFELKTYTEDY